MDDLMRYAAALEGGQARGLPPVASWNPEYCGELNLVIRRDGVWVHEGTPIGRARLVRLFSTVLKKEGSRYFLVTPAEKLGIEVVDAPFLAVLMRAEGSGADRRLVFTTNVADEVVADREHPITYRPSLADGGLAPYIHVRDGLEALIARSVFYDLAAIGETRDVDGTQMFGVASAGVFFPFGDATAVFEGSSGSAAPTE